MTDERDKSTCPYCGRTWDFCLCEPTDTAWPDGKLKREMLADIERLEHLHKKDGFVLDSTTLDVCCHARALLGEVERLSELCQKQQTEIETWIAETGSEYPATCFAELASLRAQVAELKRLKSDAVELAYYRQLRAAGGVSDD